MRVLRYLGWWTSMDGTGNEGVDMGDRCKKGFLQCDNLIRLVSGGNRCLCLLNWWDWDGWGNSWFAHSDATFNGIESSDPNAFQVVGKVWLEVDRGMNLLTMEFEDGRESWRHRRTRAARPPWLKHVGILPTADDFQIGAQFLMPKAASFKFDFDMLWWSLITFPRRIAPPMLIVFHLFWVKGRTPGCHAGAF